jgi:hypothetical protein
VIEAPNADWQAVAAAVLRHNRSEIHERWQPADDQASGPRPANDARDVSASRPGASAADLAGGRLT